MRILSKLRLMRETVALFVIITLLFDYETALFTNVIGTLITALLVMMITPPDLRRFSPTFLFWLSFQWVFWLLNVMSHYNRKE